MAARNFKHHPSAEYQAAVEALRKIDPDSRTRAFAEAIAESNEQEWAKSRGLVRCGGHPCIRRLLGMKCSAWQREDPPCLPPMSDHLSMWRLAGHREPHVFVSQPYPRPGEQLVELVEFCRHWKLDLEIDTFPAWHFPGRVLMIEIRRQSDVEDAPV